MKALFKILVAIVIVHAVVQAGIVAWNYYQLRDTALQLITFGSQVQTTQIHNQILSVGWEMDLPITSEDVLVRRQGTRTTASASYVQPYEFFPNNFYPVELSFQVDAFALSPGAVDEEN